MRTIMISLFMTIVASPPVAMTCQLQEILNGEKYNLNKTVLVQMDYSWGYDGHKVRSIAFSDQINPFCYEFGGEWRCASGITRTVSVDRYDSSVIYEDGSDFIIIKRQVFIDNSRDPAGAFNFVNNVAEVMGRYSCKQ
jgi:hypothetical protein